MRRPCQLPKLAWIAWVNRSRDMTESCGHVVLDHSLQGTLATVAESAMEQVHGQGVVEDLCLATGRSDSISSVIFDNNALTSLVYLEKRRRNYCLKSRQPLRLDWIASLESSSQPRISLQECKHHIKRHHCTKHDNNIFCTNNELVSK